VSALGKLRAKRALVVADSCFTASKPRAAKLADDGTATARRQPNVRTRVVLTSGGLEPIQDGAGGPYSVLTGALLKALRDNDGPLEGESLFAAIQRISTSGASQNAEYEDIRGAGHEGGDFVFFPTKR
jgi:hypothetical protein